MSWLEAVVQGMSDYIDELIRENSNLIEDLYVTEENRETVRGKYFDMFYGGCRNETADLMCLYFGI